MDVNLKASLKVCHFFEFHHHFAVLLDLTQPSLVFPPVHSRLHAGMQPDGRDGLSWQSKHQGGEYRWQRQEYSTFEKGIIKV